MTTEPSFGGLYEMTADRLDKVHGVTFESAGIYERGDLQRLLRDQIEIISPNTFVIAEEFCEWDDSRRRIDLLGLDRDANLVVIELKRDETGAHMELQALRYAAMVSTMNFEQAVKYHAKYGKITEDEARSALLKFLEWDEPDDEHFAQDVRIVLASADFSRELATTVLWLTNEHNLDIACVRLRPYRVGERNGEPRILVAVQQAIPLPEAADYQIRVREKAASVRVAGQNGRDYTRYILTIAGQEYPPLNKRKVIFAAVQRLVRDLGVLPQDVTAALGKDYWVSIDRQCDSEEEFVEAVRAAWERQGKRFDPSRYFTGDDDLVHLDGQTYAFFNNWGTNTADALRALQSRFPDARVEFRAAAA